MKQRITTFLKGVPDIIRYLMIAAVALFISLMFPNASSFNYQMQQGGIWRYNDLKAPFDYPIQKPEEEYNQEIKSLESTLYPYFSQDSQVVDTQKIMLREQFSEKLLRSEQGAFPDVRQNQGKYISTANQLLNNIYAKGILQADKKYLSEGENTIINLLKDKNNATKRVAKNLPSVKSARAVAKDSLRKSPLPEVGFLFDLVEDAIVPNIIYDDETTNRIHKLEKNKIARSKGMVSKGEVIVRRGDYIDSNTYQKLISLKDSYKNEKNNKNQWLIYAGYLILTLLLLGALVLYLAIYAKDLFKNFRKLLFIMMWILVFSYAAHFSYQFGYFNAFAIPFCIAPIVIKNLYNERIALFTHLIIILFSGFLAVQGYEFLFIQILAGIVVVLSDVKTHNWTGFFRVIVYLLLIYLSAYLALEFINEGNFTAIHWQSMVAILFNIGLTLLAYPLVPLLERLFGFTSEMTLIELSSMDKPLLKELALKAPGTLQHSLQVGILSENAASSIGANALLVKVAAMYHDIGKMVNPLHFIENQGRKSLHNDLTPLESAAIILAHVKDGEKRAKKEGLPKILIDFITTHHGTTRVEYFYQKHLKANPDTEPNEEAFTYKGRKPQTKEQAIMMMADSLEAAAKSQKNIDENLIDKLVEKIIGSKIASGQFDEAELTYREMIVVKESFKKMLKSIHHLRIQYPGD